MIENTTNRSIDGLRELHEDVSIEPISSIPSANHRAGSNDSISTMMNAFVLIEYSFIWFGRIVNRTWSNDYTNLHSLLSRNLRLDLENLVNHFIDSLTFLHRWNFSFSIFSITIRRYHSSIINLNCTPYSKSFSFVLSGNDRIRFSLKIQIRFNTFCK